MPYGEDITINVGDAVRIHPKYENYKFKKLKHDVVYRVDEVDEIRIKGLVGILSGDTIHLNMDKSYFEHVGKEEKVERNYNLEIGDVILIAEWGWGFYPEEDIGKYVEVVGFAEYIDGAPGVIVKPYNDAKLYTEAGADGTWMCGYESFGDNPLILLNTKEEFEAPEPNGKLVKLLKEDSFCQDHYNMYYTLTEKDIAAGKIKVDAYWVAKQWKTGSRDDSGALWHSLKTIARFGEKNDKAREIKALYNQAIALARIYDVEL